MKESKVIEEGKDDLKNKINDLFKFIDILYRKVDRIEQMITVVMSELYNETSEDDDIKPEGKTVESSKEKDRDKRDDSEVELDKRKEMEYDYDRIKLTEIV